MHLHNHAVFQSLYAAHTDHAITFRRFSAPCVVRSFPGLDYLKSLGAEDRAKFPRLIAVGIGYEFTLAMEAIFWAPYYRCVSPAFFGAVFPCAFTGVCISVKFSFAFIANLRRDCSRTSLCHIVSRKKKPRVNCQVNRAAYKRGMKPQWFQIVLGSCNAANNTPSRYKSQQVINSIIHKLKIELTGVI